ncbi:MAG: K(+)-transporting ATPase subunit F [Bdellovibrio sp.]|nr:K(+)-transporting ATPase subunit F [Methylotenera sp.]
MNIIFWISGLLALFILIYLFYVLVKPENF